MTSQLPRTKVEYIRTPTLKTRRPDRNCIQEKFRRIRKYGKKALLDNVIGFDVGWYVEL